MKKFLKIFLESLKPDATNALSMVTKPVLFTATIFIFAAAMAFITKLEYLVAVAVLVFTVNVAYQHNMNELKKKLHYAEYYNEASEYQVNHRSKQRKRGTG